MRPPIGDGSRGVGEGTTWAKQLSKADNHVRTVMDMVRRDMDESENPLEHCPYQCAICSFVSIDGRTNRPMCGHFGREVRHTDYGCPKWRGQNGEGAVYRPKPKPRPKRIRLKERKKGKAE